MKEVIVKAYEFDELDDKAKEKAREWFRSGNCDDNSWSECTLEEAEEQAALMGIDITNNKDSRGAHIYWSGFWSQGDGACFEGTWRASDVKADKVADGWGEHPATTGIKRIAAVFAEIAKKYPHASFTVKHRGHYSHEHCTEFDFNSGHEYCEPKDLESFRDSDDQTDDGLSDKMDDCFFQGTDDELKEAAKDFMRWIYRQLEKEYEYQNSDEQVDDNIRANEYLFTESGSRSTVL
tara:strand:+ start:8326 stop:9033 length:708 start_codon:yes stop_codon:yes gene_type:complete